MKEEFLTTLSHEIRTPLNAVVGWTKILLGRHGRPDDACPGASGDRSQRARADAADRRHARHGAGDEREAAPRMRPVDLAAIAFAAIDVVAPAAAAKTHRRAIRVETDAPWVLGDADRLQQVVWNLLSNSIKFTEPGGSVTVVLALVGGAASVEGQRHRVRHPCRVPAPDVRALPPAGRLRQSPPRRPRIGLVAAFVSWSSCTAAPSRPRAPSASAPTITVAFPSHHPIAMTTSPEATIQVDTSALAGLGVLLVEDREDALEILCRRAAADGHVRSRSAICTRSARRRSTPQRRRE